MRNDARRVARGEYAIYIPQIFAFASDLKGLPVKVVVPKEGAPYAETDSENGDFGRRPRGESWQDAVCGKPICQFAPAAGDLGRSYWRSSLACRHSGFPIRLPVVNVALWKSAFDPTGCGRHLQSRRLSASAHQAEPDNAPQHRRNIAGQDNSVADLSRSAGLDLGPDGHPRFAAHLKCWSPCRFSSRRF
jgi:hypothetical protein